MNPTILIPLFFLLLYACKKDKTPTEVQVAGNSSITITILDTSNSAPISGCTLYVEERDPNDGFLKIKGEFLSNQKGEITLPKPKGNTHSVSIFHKDYLLKHSITGELPDSFWLKPYVYLHLSIDNKSKNEIKVRGGFNEDPFPVFPRTDTTVQISYPVFQNLSVICETTQGKEYKKSFWIDKTTDTLSIEIQ